MINNLFMISRFFCEKKKVSKRINYKKISTITINLRMEVFMANLIKWLKKISD